ncbi:glutathione S-transferase family protein [Microbulbifer agarilyticus]|uniref:glutathione S-transferase family protein n=1 Tax=Microbulbifer agarilyticus TaxID=260552 RepID=UPI001C97A6A7|nr:glutathione S-transferase family protein [Microbulbifer agarilyticus]MBY6191107.1 glutathione S-transferase family protein [Microbulbifer agarilyticus]
MYRLYGVEISLFSSKVRAYMNYKGLNYEEKAPNILDFRRFEKAVNARVMPVVETQEGDLLGDTSLIIEALERQHPEPSITPKSGRLKIAAMLFEAWVDEVNHLIAGHTRWSYDENFPLFRDTMGKAMFPFLPKFLQDWMVGKTAVSAMRKHKPRMGFVPDQIPLLDRWIVRLLDSLEVHFQDHDYLFGGKPTVADFALVGCCHGHLYMDPWPRRELIEPRPHLKAYTERVHSGKQATGEWFSDDELPDTLMSVISMMFTQLYAINEQTVDIVENLIEKKHKQSGDILPRFPGNIDLPMLDETYNKMTFSYSLWMLQRIQQACSELTKSESSSLSHWFEAMGVKNFEKLSCGPALIRHGLTVKLA